MSSIRSSVFLKELLCFTCRVRLNLLKLPNVRCTVFFKLTNFKKSNQKLTGNLSTQCTALHQRCSCVAIHNLFVSHCRENTHCWISLREHTYFLKLARQEFSLVFLQKTPRYSRSKASFTSLKKGRPIGVFSKIHDRVLHRKHWKFLKEDTMKIEQRYVSSIHGRQRRKTPNMEDTWGKTLELHCQNDVSHEENFRVFHDAPCLPFRWKTLSISRVSSCVFHVQYGRHWSLPLQVFVKLVGFIELVGENSY